MTRIIPVRVLVIDDDAAVCRQVGSWLREAACDVIAFTDPREALAQVEQVSCQVGLVDLRLTGADGADVIAELGRAAPALRVIALSAFPDAGHVIAAVRAGARDVLEKPLRQETLLAALQRQLRDAGITVRSEQEFNRRLGARLRAARSAAGLTLADVVERCGLTAAQLSQIELGKSATSTWTLARICAALETSPAAVWSGL